VTEAWPWLSLVALGAYHGLNPAMGWLFAVALGFQERSRAAVLRALPFLALGHEASVALVVLLISGAQAVVSPQLVRPVGAVALIAFGVYKLLRPRSHPRWVGMRVSARDLVVWSFLMSTAHGAGLMLLPVLLGLGPQAADALEDLGDLQPGMQTLVADAAAVVLHTGAMLLAMLAIALLVYEKLGVMVLRRAWLNFDALWAVVVVGAGAVTLFT
jgi:hypothetical protein